MIDVYSGRIVGWRSASSMPTELPLEALEMALASGSRAGVDVSGVIHHSDAGAQYTSIRYTTRLLDGRRARVDRQRWRLFDCEQNAACCSALV